MNKKILYINETPSINSYVHHSYVNAIIENEEIATLFIEGLNENNWFFQNTDILYTIDKENNLLYLKEGKGRNSTSFFLKRRCSFEDEIVVKLEDVKLLDSLFYVRLALRTDDKVEMEDDDGFFVRWNQYDITIKDSHIPYSTHFYVYYKIKRCDDKVWVFCSNDKNNWHKLLYSEDIVQKKDLFLYIHIYYGSNQYERWMNMNYIQLFYNEVDRNSVYLDYFMFPRKSYDASYQYFCHFLDTEYMELSGCLEYYEDIVHFIRHSIQQNYYVNICIDEFYIPGNTSYQQQHYNHFNLFYGYDDGKQMYYILGYNEKGKLVTSTISYQVVNKEVCSNNIVRYKYKANTHEFTFVGSYVIEMIREYLYGLDSSLRYAGMLGNVKGTFGIKVFDKLRYTETGRNNLLMDKRISYVLYEHCRLMKDRLLYCNNKGMIKHTNRKKLFEKCDKMVYDSEILKNMVLKNLLTGDYEKRILMQVNKLYMDEIDFYYFFLEVCKCRY